MNVFEIRWRLGLALAAVCVCEFGCSAKPTVAWGTAGGSIRIHGELLTKGTVVFENRELGIKRMAAIKPNGSYVERSMGFGGLPVGKYRVAVTSQQISPGDFVAAAAPQDEKTLATIPDKFRKPETSKLTADVKDGINPAFDFDLQP